MRVLPLTDPAFLSDPHAYFARLRREAPVARHALGGTDSAWLVTRYDDVSTLLASADYLKKRPHARGHRIETRRKLPLPDPFSLLENHLALADPPDHTRLRNTVRDVFGLDLADRMRSLVQTVVEALIHDMLRRRTVDLIRDLAIPTPKAVIGELLGIPAPDRSRFLGWVTTLARHWRRRRALPHAWLFTKYVRRVIRARRSSPGSDLVSTLVNAATLTDDELLGMIFVLVTAGFVTTVDLIGNTTLALIDHPEQAATLRQQPEYSSSAVEEGLRFESPLKFASIRFAKEDLTISGEVIHRGDAVYAVLASANRDESQFIDPDRFDVTRNPNRHLAFGRGIHHCLGAPIARMEGEVIFRMLFDHVSDIRLACPRDELRWKPSLMFRGLESLPVTLRK